MTFDTEKLIRKFSEEPKSVHYRKPADNGQVTELQPDFKVKSVIEKEGYDMIYKAGYMEALNQLDKFIDETRPPNMMSKEDYKVLQERSNVRNWIAQQRKTLNSYL